MKWTDLKMQTKLIVFSLVGILGVMLVGGTSTWNLKRSNDRLQGLNQTVNDIVKFTEMKGCFLHARLDLVYMMSLDDEVKLARKYEDLNIQVQTVAGLLRELEKGNLDAVEREQLRIFREGGHTWSVAAGKLAQMLMSARRSQDHAAIQTAANFGVEQVAPLYDRPAAAIAFLVEHNTKKIEAERREAIASQKREMEATGAIVLAVIVTSLCIGFLITRGITLALTNVFDTMAAIAGGDLTVVSTVTSADEMGMLGREINLMREKLAMLIGKLSESSRSISSASVQMNRSAEQMSTSTEELAAQAATIATACEEMSATSSDIANNCQQAAEDSARANAAAQTGAEVVDGTVVVMGKIADRVRQTAGTVANLGARSEQIGEIIGTIEDIADQTNLLALNAAIEAARAGEQGRGFAVVADEVRALAERTTTATREIGVMIKTIQQETQRAVCTMDEGVTEVQAGTVEASKSGEALRRILEQISNVTAQINQIAVAAEEQTATTTEINRNIQQITEVANLTSVSSHEETAAANQMSQLAEGLKVMVARFHLA